MSDLLDEQAQLREKLAEQKVDPELIDHICYCVDTVVKTGKEPRQRESFRTQLEAAKMQPSRYRHQRAEAEPYTDFP